MFDIQMLPAHHGDSLMVAYGPPDVPRRVLIDCGTAASYPAVRRQILALPEKQRHFELVVVTHVDDDHIGGMLKLLAELDELGMTVGDIWFNAFPHLEGKTIASGPDLLGAKQGEALSKLIVEAGLPWNRLFRGRAVVCRDGEPPPEVTLPGGMKLTLLSPYWAQLEKMRAAWIAECRKAHLLPGGGVEDFVVDDTLGEDVDALARLPFDPDKAPANGSSIAFIGDYAGTRVLFGADAYAPVLVKSLLAMGYSADDPYPLAAMKAPHHGSSHNFSRELMELAPSARILISTNGDKFRHPDLAAVARMVKYNAPDATLAFNYASEFNSFWAKPSRQEKYRYKAVYPETEGEGLTVQLRE